MNRPAGLPQARWNPAPSIIPEAPRTLGPFANFCPKLPRCPELECVRGLLPAGAFASAELRAAEVGVGADRVLITHGLIDEQSYLSALGRELGIAFEPLGDKPREACALTDRGLIEGVRRGLLWFDIHGRRTLVIAPRERSVRRLLEALPPNSKLTSRIRLTTCEQMTRFANQHAERTLRRQASNALRTERPDLSAGTGQGRSIATAVLVAAIAVFALLMHGAVAAAIDIALGIVFLAWTILRLLGIVSRRSLPHTPPRVSDSQLPIYSVVIALYREAAAVDGLIEALRKLNYPRERLDIKLILEPDDHTTQSAVAAMRLTAPFEVLIAPQGEPRTKPKALNAALLFARGDFIAIYDAEDRPEPDQLRLALEAFLAGDNLACVQARLTIDNTSDSWLTRLFTAEYAGLFDVFLPGLAAWRLPIPLGGSSNHFRTDVLRKIGAWDPYNVTEDADLGMRLARRGYRTAVIQSTTYEEAPASFFPWLKQRTRWCKGWLQTWLVHMRSPRTLLRELDWRGFAVFQLLVGGTVLAALVHSLFVAKLMWEFAAAAGEPAAMATMAPHAAFLAIGYLVFIAISLVGLFRRRLLRCGWALVLLPVYWVLLSLAAWRALYQLVSNPYRWEKTEHGLARTSRLAQHPGGSPQVVRDTGADRLPLRRAAASY